MYSRIQTLEWRQDGGDSYGLYTEVQQHIILLLRIKLREQGLRRGAEGGSRSSYGSWNKSS